MDTLNSRSEPRYSDGDHNHWLIERPEDMDHRSREAWRLVDVLLSGGAPWGFTLKGGREHREPLLITKVEEGSKAAVSLQVGDEMVNINQIPLSGYRQEAICLVKGSYKILNLVVKRNMTMVDLVATGKMPSETDVHVARSFLNKILRSSMRKNEAVSRPHSWHATKFNESQSETAKTQSPPLPVWQTRYDASSSSTNLSSSGWDQNQTNLRRVSDQFSSLGSMDSLDVSYPPGQLSPGCLSPVKSNTSTELPGGGKRDSAYSSFSTNSGTPDYTLSKTPDYTLSKTPDYTLSKTPDYTLSKTPDYTLSKTPDYTLSKTPDYTLPKAPDYTLPKAPDYTLPKAPDYTLPKAPDYTLPKAPDYTLPKAPDYTLPKAPDYTLPKAPDYTLPKAPDYTLPKAPDYTLPKAPDYTLPKAPDYTLPKAPDYTLPKAPDYTLPKAPDYTLPKAPDYTLPKAPDYTLPKAPDYTLPKAPDYTLPKAPDYTLPKAPDYTLPKSNAASIENMLYEVSQWESGGRPSNGRHSLSSEGVRQDERPGYLQLAVGLGASMDRDSPRTEEQSGPGSSHSSSSARSSCGPVWYVPDKKKTSDPSPPPPPVRSDSFAATKSHEKVLVIACPEGPGAHTQPNAHGKGLDKGMDSDNSQCANDSRRSHHNLPSKNNMVPPYISPKNCHQNQVNCNELCSLSSSDVRLGQPHPTYLPCHQRQYSNESSLYSHPRTWSVPKQRNVSGCYSSMQELPTNENAQNTQLYSQTPNYSTQNTLLYSQTPNYSTQNTQLYSQTPDSTEDSRYYCVTARQPGQPVTQALLVKTDDRRGGGGREEGVEGGGERRSAVSIVQGRGDKKSLTPLGSGGSSGETVDLSGNQCTRTDRYATTLRNEIQMRRAQLQKSKSAASLSGPCEAEEDHEVPEVWRPKDTTSSSDGSFTSTYKDHLKEAQARVLKATSFRRRDLEPVLLEHPGAEPGSPPDSSSGLGRSDNSNPLSSLSEGLPARSGSAQSQVTRIGSRKRFTTEKKVRCFSEPDKINEVGVEEEQTPPEAAGALLNRRSTARPAFTRPLPKTALPGPVEDWGEGKETARGDCDMSSGRKDQRECQGQDHRQQRLELQRLGTFAEYETTWNTQRKAAETRGSGRSHSADNILDPGGDGRTKPAPVHERSSPSSDFYDKSHVPGRKSAEYSHLDSQPAQQDNNTTVRLSDRCRVGEFRGSVKREKALEPLELKDFPEPPPPVTNEESPDIRSTAAPFDPLPVTSAPCPAYHRPTSISYQPLETDLPPPDESYTEPQTSMPQLYTQLQSGTRRKGPIPPPRQDHSRHSQNAHSQESLSGSQGGASASHAPVSSHSPRGDSEQSRGLVEREQEAVRQVVPSNPGPALPALPSMECHRSPSPQFAPPQLTDKPPVSLQQHHDNPVSLSVCLHYDQNDRMENVMEPTSVRKVPIKIVHSESEKEKESRQYLLRHSHSTVEEAQGPGLVPLSSLGTSGAPEQSYSLFCAYSRQRDQGPEIEKTLAPPSYPAPELPTSPPLYQTPTHEMDLEQHRDTHMGPLRVHNSQMAVLATSPPSRQTTSDPASGNCVFPPVPLPHSEEDVKREQLARDIINKDRSLADILDKSWRRTTMDLMEGLFPQGEVLLEGKERRNVSPKHSSPRSSEDRSEEDSVAAAVALVTSSTYYSTSAPKAELLIKLKDMQEREGLEEELEEESADELDHDLANKKQELVDSLSRKLQVLREARESLQEDVHDNNALGEEVEATVQQVCTPNQLDKFRMFIGDLDKVVSLLLSLSGRLARVENALNSLEEGTSPEERRTLTDKRKLLIQQHEDAKELKENLDRRERVVYNILATYLPEESLTDYQHFVKMKSALIIEQRKLEDKIKLGEEQLKCLMDSLPLEQRISL